MQTKKNHLTTEWYVNEYLNNILGEFKDDYDNGRVDAQELTKIKGVHNYVPEHKSDGTSDYSNKAYQRLYLLQYAYAYGFEYLSMCKEFIKDFKDEEKISVVSLGCGAMPDYWALACMLENENVSKPVVKYHGIDAVVWEHSLKVEARKKTKDRGPDDVTFFPERLEVFLNRPDNKFNANDVYFFPKSISEFSYKSDNGKKSVMDIILDSLSKFSEIEEGTKYFCFALRKQKIKEDVIKVQDIISKLETETGFCVINAKLISTNAKETIKEIEENEKLKNGSLVKNVEPIEVGSEEKSEDKKYIGEEDVSENIGGYPPFPTNIKDDLEKRYIIGLKEQCMNKPSDESCGKCKKCFLATSKPTIKAKYICDLIIKFEKKKTP